MAVAPWRFELVWASYPGLGVICMSRKKTQTQNVRKRYCPLFEGAWTIFLAIILVYHCCNMKLVTSVSVSVSTSAIVFMSCVGVDFVDSHGMMLTPLSRNAVDGLLTSGGTMWFSQGCSIGCESCNESAPISAQTIGDLCPEFNKKNKTPVLNDPTVRTYSHDAPTEPADQDFTRFHP